MTNGFTEPIYSSTSQPEKCGMCAKCGHQAYVGLWHDCPTAITPLDKIPYGGWYPSDSKETA